jgi:hypothetical protein
VKSEAASKGTLPLCNNSSPHPQLQKESGKFSLPPSCPKKESMPFLLVTMDMFLSKGPPIPSTCVMDSITSHLFDDCSYTLLSGISISFLWRKVEIEKGEMLAKVYKVLVR